MEEGLRPHALIAGISPAISASIGVETMTKNTELGDKVLGRELP